MSELYDPEVPPFANEALMEKSRKLDAETAGMMQILLSGGEVEWQREAADWAHTKKN